MMVDREDRDLLDALRAQAPPAVFDEARIRQRVETTVSGPGHEAARGRRRSVLATAVRATLRLAAALALFAGGAVAGRVTAVPRQPVAIGMFDPVSDVPFVVEPSDIPLSIQATGTDYVSSLAMLSEMEAALTPEQRTQAREVAVAVLSGAIAELMLSGLSADPESLIRTLTGEAASSAVGDPLLWR